jgi:hypothetical protein
MYLTISFLLVEKLIGAYCRGMSYEQNMMYADLTGNGIWPEVVTQHSQKCKFMHAHFCY